MDVKIPNTEDEKNGNLIVSEGWIVLKHMSVTLCRMECELIQGC